MHRQLHYLDEGEEVVGEAIDTRTDAADTLSAGPDAADTVAAAHPSDSDTSSGTSDSDMELDERLGLMLRNLHVPFSDMGMKQRLRRSLKNIFQDIQDMGELDCHRLPADSRKLAKKVRDLGAHVASLVTNFEESLRPWGSSGYRRLYKVIGSSSDSDGESCGPEDVGTGGKRKLTPTFLLAKAQPGPHTAASPAPTPPLDQTQPTEEVASQSSAAPLGNLAAEEDSDKGFEKRGGSAVAPLTTAADLTATFKVGPRNEAGEGEGISTEARNSDSSSLESTSGRSCCGSGSGAVGLESAAGSSHSAGTSASNCVENTGSSCSGGGGGQGDGDHWGLEGCPVPGSRAGDAVCRQDGAVDAGNCVCLDPSSAEPAQDGFLNRLFEILRFDEEAFFMDVFPVVRSLGPRRSHGEEGPLGSWRSEAGTAAAGEGREEVTGGALTGNVAEKQQQEGTEKSAGGAGSSGWAKKGMMEYSVQRKLEERADAYVGAVTAAAFKNFNLHRVLGRHRSLGLRMWLRDLVKSMDGEVKAMQKDPKLAIAEGWLQLWEEHTARAHWFLEELRIGISLSDIHATMRRHLANSLLEAPGQPDREDCCRMAELSIKLQLDLRDVAAYQTERLAADDPQGAFEPPTSSCHDSNPFTATFEDPSSAELAEDDWIHVVDQDLAPLWLRLAQRSLDVTAALRGRKRVEILVHGSDVQTHFEIIAHMCLMYEKDLAMLVLLDDDVGFGNGGELQQRHPEPPPVVSAATASETRAHSRQPRTRSGKAGADAAAAAARERGAVANGVPAVARSDLQCELLARRFEVRLGWGLELDLDVPVARCGGGCEAAGGSAAPSGNVLPDTAPQRPRGHVGAPCPQAAS
ncbi:hypothetical protein Vafri_4807 [Volvox africanus]|uniref:Uncharacterized protein n=1 Tax=Volvox africanus TaxID=51714 RepID=A0A8J4AUF7_9CHLO|nr:hypothetical protein Vafri_4807 [Volvox africanus]